MKQSSSSLANLAALLANVAAAHSLFIIFAFAREFQADTAGLLAWWAALVLTYGALSLFLRRPRQLRGVVLMCLGGAVVQALLTWLLGVRYPSLAAGLCLLAMWSLSYMRCYEILVRPVPAEKLMTAFETTVLAFLFITLYCTAGGLGYLPVVPSALGVLFTLAALGHHYASNPQARQQGPGSPRGRTLQALLLAVLGLGAAACAALLTGTGARGLTALTGLLRRLGSALLSAFVRFLEWLVSLIPPMPTGPLELPEPMEGLAATEAAMEELPQNSALLYVFAGLLLLFAAGFILWVLIHSRRRTIRLSVRPRRSIQRRRPRLGELLARLWRRACRAVRFNVRYLLRRNTPEGLLVWLERRMARRRAGRGRGETCRAFLERVELTRPHCREGLRQLSLCLDAGYFGSGGPTMSPAQVARLRRALRRPPPSQ